MNHQTTKLVLDLSEVGAGDVQLVGGKCASLGELFCSLGPRGVNAVDGFATTSDAYRLLLEQNGVLKRLRELMRGLDYKDIDALGRAGHQARTLILEAGLPGQLANEIIDAYHRLSERLAEFRKSLFARLPQPKICRTRRSPASKTRT